MTLVRWKPRPVARTWSPFRDFEAEFDRVFGNLACARNTSEPAWVPTVDIHESEDAYTIEADLPGVSKDKIDVTINDNVITLKGERKSEREAKEGGYRHYERSVGSFERSFTVSKNVDTEAVEAKFENGVLRLTLPKREEAKPKQIEVKLS